MAAGLSKIDAAFALDNLHVVFSPMRRQRQIGDVRVEGFALVRIKNWVWDGHICTIHDNLLAVFIALLAHENADTREAFPSIDRLSRLAGVGKARTIEALGELERRNWLRIAKRPGRGFTPRNIYTFTYKRYVPGESDASEWLRIDHVIVHNGIWAKMPPSARKLYIVMRAYARMGHHAEEGFLPSHYLEDGDFDCEYDFLPADELPPEAARTYTGLSQRTLLNARNWLLDNEIIVPTEPHQYPGLIIPHRPRRYAPDVLDAIAAKQQEVPLLPASAQAKKCHRAMQKRAKSTAKKSVLCQSVAVDGENAKPAKRKSGRGKQKIQNRQVES